MNFYIKFILIIFTMWGHHLYAHPYHLDDIEVSARTDKDLPRNRIKKDSIDKTELISKKKIDSKAAHTLSQAVDNEMGIDTQLSCANCGSKRISVNGLRGEHTTVLVDGIPLHSAVSSFYGMDAVPMVGIESIEVTRGAGASLHTPEAIGGVINLQTIRPIEDLVRAQVTIGEVGMQDIQALGVKSYNEGRQGVVIGAQYSSQDHFDVDQNGVSESPDMSNQGIFLKYRSKLSSKGELNIRTSYQELELLGGTTKGYRANRFTETMADETDFRNGDVRKKFLGSQRKISDRVTITRREVSSTYNYHLSDDTNLKFTSALALQSQDAIYMHGYDYANNDSLNFNDIKLNTFIGDDHLFTFGIDNKNHSFKSDSIKLYDEDGLRKDNFEHKTLGFYIQDEWFLSPNLELAFALRLDKITVDWTDYKDKAREIDETILAPRFRGVYRFAQNWSTRFNAGVGYRSPLTLFESQHGSTHDGFEIEIDRLERALGSGLTLEYSKRDFFMNTSLNYTKVRNLAYAKEQTNHSHEPLLFKNQDRASEIWAYDIEFGFDPIKDFHFSISHERFVFPDHYASALPVAVIESRTRLQGDYHFDNFEWITTLNFIGQRDLKRYGYDSHYNVYDGTNLTSKKWQRAPSFFTLDTVLNYSYNQKLTLKAGILNVFDYTQTRAGDSPLTWDQHGNHAHLDNFHLWGPTRGRQMYIGLNYEI